MNTDIVFINGLKFNTLVASTLEEQMVGLMWKKWPPPIMVFPYKDAGIHKFWMKNTISPLDIVFCRNNKIIGIYAGEPLSTAQVGPDAPVDLVIEFPRGTMSMYGIKAGDIVEFRPGLERISRDIVGITGD